MALPGGVKIVAVLVEEGVERAAKVLAEGFGVAIDLEEEDGAGLRGQGRLRIVRDPVVGRRADGRVGGRQAGRIEERS
jgi:hypothetical protein